MQHKQKHMLARPNLKQMRTQWRIALQIKRNARRSRKRCPKLPFAYLPQQKPNPRRTSSQYLLPRNPFPLREDGAQALVPLNHIPQRSFQRRDIQIPSQPYRQRDRVVRSPTFQPLQKPQPTLRKRQRHFRRTQNRTQRRTRLAALAQPGRKPRNRARLKQAADRYLNIKARPNPADQPRRKQRVPAQRKKVILNPNSLDPQHLRKQPAQNLLLRRARQTTPTPPPILRRRQRAAVQLPVRRQRKTIKLNDRGRNHVLREPQTNMRAQRTRIHLTARCRYHIANKLPPALPIRPRNNRRLRHTPVRKQRRLDLPRLNPKPANLHLLVRTPHKLQNPIKPPARQVPAAVHPTPQSPIPIRYKALRRQPTTTQIPPRQPSSRYVKLPYNPNRYRLQTTVQNVNTVVGQRTANRDVWARLLTFDSKANCVDCRFGRAIKIGDGLDIETARNLFRKRRREELSPQHQMV